MAAGGCRLFEPSLIDTPIEAGPQGFSLSRFRARLTLGELGRTARPTGPGLSSLASRHLLLDVAASVRACCDLMVKRWPAATRLPFHSSICWSMVTAG